MELGLATFVDLASGVSPEQRMRDLLEEAELADQLGLDLFAVGEHHRADYLISSPAVGLAAIAARTERIRLSSAVTVLSSDDPVRVFQQFAELDLISGGRAEIMAGRGSFHAAFPAFGYDLDDYDELYAEKLDLLLAIRESERVTWSGRLPRGRPALHEAGIYPRPVQNPLPVWVAVGGTPQSVVRAGVLGLPLTLAIIGGQPERFAPLVALFRRAAIQAGHDAAVLPLAINTHAFVAETSQAADSAFAAPYLAMMNKIGRERGSPAPPPPTSGNRARRPVRQRPAAPARRDRRPARSARRSAHPDLQAARAAPRRLRRSPRSRRCRSPRPPCRTPERWRAPPTDRIAASARMAARRRRLGPAASPARRRI